MAHRPCLRQGPRRHASRLLFAVAAAFALTACGGGGGSSPPAAAPPPVAVQPAAIVTQPASQSVAVGQSATFTVAATGDGLSYQWQRDGQDIAGAAAANYTLSKVQLTDNGARFTVIVRNSGGSATSAAATLKVTVPATTGKLSLVAGPLGGYGNLDGPVGRFSSQLSDIAASPSGTLYLNDRVPWQVVRVITQAPGQEAGVSTLPREQFAVIGAVDAAGNVYEYADQQIYKLTPAGVRTLVAGNGSAGAVLFKGIGSMAVDASGTLYVADGPDHTIRKVTPEGLVTTLAGSPGQDGSQDGQGAAARFMGPGRLAIDKAGDLYAIDANVVRKITRDGSVTTLALHAADTRYPGNDPTVFNNLDDIDVDAGGNLYVLSGNLRRIAQDGGVTHLTPPGSPSGHGPFGIGSSLTHDGAGNLYVASTELEEVLRVGPDGATSVVAGKALQTDSVDGTGMAAHFSGPGAWPASSLSVDAQGTVLLTEGDRVRKISPAGAVSTLALPASDSELWPTTYYMTGDAGGGDLLAFKFGVLSRIDANGNSHFLAGHAPAGQLMLSDGVGANASFVNPQGFVPDGLGNVYCLDQTPEWAIDRAWHGVIRKIGADGTVTTLPVANLPYLGSWFVDRDGKLVMATAQGAVLRLEADNSLSTLRPGQAQAYFEPASTMVAGDRDGNLYLADYLQTGDTMGVVLHKIAPDGSDTVIAGKPDTQGVVLGSANSLNAVQSLAVGSDGTVYIMTENSVLKLSQ